MESAGLLQDQDGRQQQEAGEEGHRAGAPARRAPGSSSRANGPEPVPAGRIQLGEPEEIHSPADVHRPQQLLLGDQAGWHRAQNHSQEFI